MQVHIQSGVRGREDWLLALVRSQVRPQNPDFLGVLILRTIILREMGEHSQLFLGNKVT